MKSFMRCTRGLTLLVGFSFMFFPGLSLARENVSRQNLITAKQLVVQMQERVETLVGYIAQGWRPDEDSCGSYRDRVTCVRAGCDWFFDENERGHCVAGRGTIGPEMTPPILENDQAANFALLGMGRGLFNLGEQIDQALLHYGTPAFWAPLQEACRKCRTLLRANQAAKVSANLPRVGIVRPADFDPFDTELDSVLDLLSCP